MALQVEAPDSWSALAQGDTGVADCAPATLERTHRHRPSMAKQANRKPRFRASVPTDRADQQS